MSGRKVQRHRSVRVAPIALAREREQETQADRGRPEPGQGDAAGGRRKIDLGPSHRRELVPELMQRFGCSQRDALRVVRMSASIELPRKLGPAQTEASS
jgi:hypothetical protein